MTNIFEAQPAQNETDLKRLVTLAEKARDLEAQKEDLNSALSQINKELQAIKENELPELMAALGMETFTLSDGTKIKVTDYVSGSLNKATDREWALEWVAEHGGEGTIKNNVSMSFDRNEHNLALSVAEDLRQQGFEVSLLSDIHPQTLAAFAREKLAEGEDIPLDQLGLFAGRRAKIS